MQSVSLEAVRIKACFVMPVVALAFFALSPGAIGNTGASQSEDAPLSEQLPWLLDPVPDWGQSFESITGSLPSDVPDSQFTPQSAETCFFAADDPLTDADLMNYLVFQGQGVLPGYAARLAEATPAQRDAVCALAVYLNLYGGDYGAVDTLLHELAAQRNPALAPVLRRLSGTREGLRLLWTDTAFDLINRGDPAAAAWLAEYFTVPATPRREVPPAPYNRAALTKALYPSEEVGLMAEGGRWTVARTQQGQLYAFVHPQLTARDVFLGVDADGDGRLEQILPTGFNDMYYLHYGQLFSVTNGQCLGRLDLRVDGAAVEIAHHDYGWTEGMFAWDEPHVTRRWDAVDLAALAADADGDGLPMSVERLLLTNPLSADSDGDGLSDAQDTVPGCNPAQLSPLERGVSRVLAL